MRPIISVIISTYNRSTTVTAAIKSVLAQNTNSKFEVIVVDDGSTDKTREAVSKLKKKFNNLFYIRIPHSGGPAKPRNIGVKHSKGDWVAFLDSDDTWNASKLEKELNFARENDLNFVCTNANRLVGKTRAPYFQGHANRTDISFSEVIKDNPVICSSVIVKREILLKVDCFPEHKQFTAIEDYACWLKIALISDLCYMSEPLVEYADNPKITIRSIWNSSKDQYRVLIPYIFRWYKSNIELSYRYISSLVPLFLAWLRTR